MLDTSKGLYKSHNDIKLLVKMDLINPSLFKANGAEISGEVVFFTNPTLLHFMLIFGKISSSDSAMMVNIYDDQCDVIASKIILAFQITKIKCPLIVLFQGNKVSEALKLVANSRLRIIAFEDSNDAHFFASKLAGIDWS